MIKRLCALLAIILSFTSNGISQELLVVRDGAYRTTALDVALDGSTLWVATSWGIATHDVTSGVPTPVATLPLEGTTSSVEVGSTRVYVASGTKVFVFARGNASAPLGVGETDGTINDILLLEPYLYAATSTGIVQFDLIDPDEPIAVRSLSTSSGFAVRLAVAGTSLYAADGDATVEVFNIALPSFPQGVGSFGSLPRTQAVSEAGGRIYVSDGQQTEIWFGSGAQMSQVGTISAGGNSVLAVGSGFVYLVGNDRRVRGFEVLSASEPTKVFVSEEAPVGGTVNRFLRIVGEGTRLHVAAGDAGLLTWETLGFGAPYLLRGYGTSTGESLASYPGGVAAAGSGAGLVRYSIEAEGKLDLEASWDAGTTSIVHDANASRLLASSGTRLRRFDLTQSAPVESGNVTLGSSVRSAVLQGENAVAVLADQTVWTADFGGGAATKAELGEAKPLFVAAGGGDLALADFDEAGTTTIRFYAGGDLGTSPIVATVEGAASSGITLSSGRVACFTFRGITLIDFSSGGQVSVIPDSATGIARDIRLSGTTLFVLTSGSLQIWDTVGARLEREIVLEGSASAVAHSDGEPSAIVATSEGLVTIQFASGTEPPELTGTAGGSNRYFSDAFLGDQTLHLWDGRDMVSAPLDSSGMPGPGRGLSPSEAAIGVVAIGDRLFFLTPTGELAGYSAAGKKSASYQIDESVDQRILSMKGVAGALWVSVEVNCLSGGCEFRTLVIDPRGGLVKSATLSGGIVDATVDGSMAFAVFEVPDEVRVIDVSDPYHPAITTQVASKGRPVSIARDGARGAIYTLGDLLYVYGNGLNLIGELLEPYETDPTGRVGYIDQQLHVIDDYAIVTGRAFSPAVYTINSPTVWLPTERPGSGAAAVRSSLLRNGLLYLLSDYSLEIWSSVGAVSPRRRPVRE